jgi:hypothetical protein
MNLSINNTTGDLDLVQGQLVIVEGQEEIKQHVEQRLRTFLNEWFLDLSIGLPYFEEILKKQVNTNGIDSIFIDEILNCPGIVRILDFNIDLAKGSRELTVEGVIQTIEGSVEFSVGVG